MDHFEPITPEHRWKNEMLDEARKTNELLEQLVTLLQTKEVSKQSSQRKKVGNS